jgi:ankyrin repeat protein
LEEVQKLLENVKEYLDLDKPDSDGTPPLVYASCFGYVDIVRALVESGASVNVQDKSNLFNLNFVIY